VRRTARRWRRALRDLRLGTVARILRTVRPGPATEERLLRMSWTSRDAARLDEYLVIGWQNPRINVQSIVIRHNLIRRLFGPGLEDIMRGELELAVELNEALRLEAERTGTAIHSFLDEQRLQRVRQVDRVIEGREHEYEVRWRAVLAERSAEPLRVVELACGSANDYRAFVDFGVARFLDYTGIDLNPKNIENAHRRFPDATFRVGNATSTGLPDASADVVIASDLFEHLPREIADAALREALRIADGGLILSFFNMADIPDDVDHPVAAYHWNLLSAPRFAGTVRTAYQHCSVTEIPRWLRAEFAYEHSYNPAAWTILAARDAAVAAIR